MTGSGIEPPSDSVLRQVACPDCGGPTWNIQPRCHRVGCPSIEPPSDSSDRCHAGEDGDCSWDRCPQLAEYRSPCPLPWWGNDDDY